MRFVTSLIQMIDGGETVTDAWIRKHGGDPRKPYPNSQIQVIQRFSHFNVLVQLRHRWQDLWDILSFQVEVTE